MQAIRALCLDCCAGQPGEGLPPTRSGVRKRLALACALWPFRLGTDPFRGRRAANENAEPAADFSAPTDVPGIPCPGAAADESTRLLPGSVAAPDG